MWKWRAETVTFLCVSSGVLPREPAERDEQIEARDPHGVLSEHGRPLPGAEFDHVFHRGLNRPEHGWLVCPACHAELTYGGYLARFARLPEFPPSRPGCWSSGGGQQPAPAARRSSQSPCPPLRRAGMSPMTSV